MSFQIIAFHHKIEAATHSEHRILPCDTILRPTLTTTSEEFLRVAINLTMVDNRHTHRKEQYSCASRQEKSNKLTTASRSYKKSVDAKCEACSASVQVKFTSLKFRPRVFAMEFNQVSSSPRFQTDRRFVLMVADNPVGGS